MTAHSHVPQEVQGEGRFAAARLAQQDHDLATPDVSVHTVYLFVARCDLSAGVVEVVLILVERFATTVDLYALIGIELSIAPVCRSDILPEDVRAIGLS